MIQATLPQVVERRDTLALAADVAIVITGLAVVLLAIVLIGAILEARSAFREVRLGIRQNLGPVSDRARKISDNVEFITDSVRTDVRRLNESVQALSDRLQQASHHMEDRIEEFNALLEAVQDEAEDLFLDTAATAHGLREGVRTIGRSRNEVPETHEARVHDTEHDERTLDPPAGGGKDVARTDAL